MIQDLWPPCPDALLDCYSDHLLIVRELLLNKLRLIEISLMRHMHIFQLIKKTECLQSQSKNLKHDSLRLFIAMQLCLNIESQVVFAELTINLPRLSKQTISIRVSSALSRVAIRGAWTVAGPVSEYIAGPKSDDAYRDYMSGQC